MSEQPREVIQFGRKELDPDEEKSYREKIAAARAGGGVNSLKGSTPVGHTPKLQNVPLLTKENAAAQASGLQPDGSVAPRPPGSPILSAGTPAQLEQRAKAPGPTPPPALNEEEIKKETKKAADEEFFDTVFDFAQRNEAERILNNRKRKKEIEDRCKPMSFEDLLWKDEAVEAATVSRVTISE